MVDVGCGFVVDETAVNASVVAGKLHFAAIGQKRVKNVHVVGGLIGKSRSLTPDELFSAQEYVVPVSRGRRQHPT